MKSQDAIPSQDYYVYALLDPSRRNEPFYIGKGRGYRVKNHYTKGYLSRNSHKSNIIKRYREMGFSDSFLIIASGLSEAAAFELEIAEIRRLGRRIQAGVLVNQSDGGEGSSGFSAPRTQQWKDRIAASNKGKILTKEHRENLRSAHNGKVISLKHRASISSSMSGREKSDQHRAALSKAAAGRKLDEAHRSIAISNLRRDEGKWYRVTSPDGEVSVIRSLKAFCAKRGLSNQHLGQVALSRRKHHKGWKAEFLEID